MHNIRPVAMTNTGRGFTNDNNKQRMRVMMCVLVACERSQGVTSAFRAEGHEAYSCDTQACEGGRPQWHIQGDAINTAHTKGPCNMMIAHLPCTYFVKGGAR